MTPRTSHRPFRFVAAVGVIVGALTFAGCAASPAPGAEPSSSSGSTPGRTADASDVATETPVVGTGTVIDVGGAALLCFTVLESYPPQCGGNVPLVDWSWDGLEGVDSASSTRWGSYVVHGVYDGSAVRVTAPPTPLARYDAAPIEPAPIETGTTDEATLLDIQTELTTELGAERLSSGVANGYLTLSVRFDDGTLQRGLDERYGDDVVVVESALRPAAG